MGLEKVTGGVRLFGGILSAGIIVVGLIVWLAQLNWVALSSTAKNVQQDIMLDNFQERQLIVTANLNKSTLLLSILIDEVRDLKMDVKDHHEEAEKWKEKIRNNTKDIETFGD
jgi:hypothetical protein